MRRYLILIPIFILARTALATEYYVDPSGSNTPPFDTLAKGANKIQTVIDKYELTGGDVIRINGVISGQKTTITSTDSGSIRHALESVTVSGSTVTFSTSPSGVSIKNDYVYLYNSFKGNSGCFRVSSLDGREVVVDTSDLPNGKFADETSSPWGLKAAIITPVLFTAYDSKNIPILDGGQDAFHLGPSAKCILVKNINCTDQLRTAILVSTGSEYIALDHLISRRSGHFGCLICSYEDRSNGTNGTDVKYCILQHSDFSEAGHLPNSTGELMYLGKDYIYQKGRGDFTHVWFTQIMYNKFHNNANSGDKRSNPDPLDGKENDRYTLIWGNEFYECNATAVYGIIKMPGGESIIANNYFKNNNLDKRELTGTITAFSYRRMTSYDQYIFNNIFDGNTPIYGDIAVDGLNLPNMRIFNNTFYGGKKSNTGIRLSFWGNPSTVGYVCNNIFQSLATGVNKPSGSTIVNDDNNFFHDNNLNFSGWSPKGNVYANNPGLSNPGNHDFSIQKSSNAAAKATNLSNFFSVDFRRAERGSTWDTGAYQHTLKPVQGLRIQYP